MNIANTKLVNLPCGNADFRSERPTYEGNEVED